MYFEKENRNAVGRYMLIFADNACQRKLLPNLTEGKWHLFLNRRDLGISSDVELVLEARQGDWQIAGRPFLAGSPFCFCTGEKEKLLLLLSGNIECLEPLPQIFLKADEIIKIGNGYTNQVFYDCFSFIKSVHAEITFKKQGGLAIHSLQEGVYVNEKVLKGQKKLDTGDRIDIYGLHLLVVKEMIICVCFGGLCRIAGGRNIPQKYCGQEHQKIKENRVRREDGLLSLPIERNYGREEALHTGEIEVLLPDKPHALPEQSLFLSLGPALTMVLPMLLMVGLSGRYMGEMGSSFYGLSALMSLCTAFLTVFWGLVTRGYNKYHKGQQKKQKERQYREYLKGVEDHLTEAQAENRRILEQRYPPASGFLREERGALRVLWNRYYKQKDFLFLRLGVGDMDFQMQIKLSGKGAGVCQGKLEKEAEQAAKKFTLLKQVPVGIDLFENRQVGLVEVQDKILLQLLLQIMICHCYTEVKIVCFYRQERALDREIAQCLKWAPHSWSADGRTRFLAGNEQEAAEILPVLNCALTKAPVKEEGSIKIPWYVVVVLNEELIMGEAIYQYLTDPKARYPVSAVFVGAQREALPKSCRCFLTEKDQQGEILKLWEEQFSRQKLLVDSCGFLEAQRYARKIAGARVRELEEDSQLPQHVDFLQLYGCVRIEELESGQRWKTARTQERLKAPIGCRAGGNLVSLDIHERFHGPHGLVAGTTGSGKSELLQTYLLSMAASYSPADVNFFMIDYKGGGTGNLLKGLPHCAGVISNLSGKQIKRAMSAIASENRRRQKQLGEFGVNHIDAYSRLYQEGKAEKPMPHLILVIDEFAELKKEEPEFMQEIISLAQVGRSLGVHLILATQKPAGTVDDKIWSNARFRMCLRVQDEQDSMDMLRNRDAAKLSAPGQCYMQIGNQEYYELFQAGYCGGIYQEEGKEKAKALLVSKTGRRKERKLKTDASKAIGQMEALVNYVRETAARHHYEAASLLWMPELPDKVVVEELQQRKEVTERIKSKTEKLPGPEIILGLCDDPENQRQFVLTFKPLLQGHMAVCGGPGTGKTTLMQTILWQLSQGYTPQQVLFLAVSMGQESFECFRPMPECMGVLSKREDKDVFFHHLKELVNRRRKQLSGVGCQQYNQIGKAGLPYIFLVIDNFSALSSQLEEKQEEFILKLASEGISLGIYMIITITSISEMKARLFEKIKTTAALEMSDRYQYGDVLRQYYLPVLPKENQKGRGLCRVQGNILEFQGALAIGEMEDYQRMHLIGQAAQRKEREMYAKKMEIPEKFPRLPEKPEFHRLAEDYVWREETLPIGYCLFTGAIREISLKETVCFLISGKERTGRAAFLSCMTEGLLSLGGQAVVIDAKGKFEHFSERNGVTYLRTQEETEKWRRAFMESEEERDKKGITGVFIGDIRSFCCFLYQLGEKRQERIRFWEQLAMEKKEKLFLAGIYNPDRGGEAASTGFFREFIRWQCGICLGGNLASQRELDFDDLDYTVQNRHEKPGIGYFKEGAGGTSERLLLPAYERQKL